MSSHLQNCEIARFATAPASVSWFSSTSIKKHVYPPLHFTIVQSSFFQEFKACRLFQNVRIPQGLQESSYRICPFVRIRATSGACISVAVTRCTQTPPCVHMPSTHTIYLAQYRVWRCDHVKRAHDGIEVVLEHTVCASRGTAPLARLYPGFSIDFQSDDPARSSERCAPSRGGIERVRCSWESTKRGRARNNTVCRQNEFHNNEILCMIKCISHYFHSFVLCIRKNRSEIKEK